MRPKVEGSHRKNEGVQMVDITIGAAGAIQPAEVKDVELYHPKSWVTKYVFSQDAKVIAIQYSITALSIGLVALVLSWLMRLALVFPRCCSGWRASPCREVPRAPAGPCTRPKPSSPAPRGTSGASF